MKKLARLALLVATGPTFGVTEVILVAWWIHYWAVFSGFAAAFAVLSLAIFLLRVLILVQDNPGFMGKL